jgi:hypothetical protein
LLIWSGAQPGIRRFVIRFPTAAGYDSLVAAGGRGGGRPERAKGRLPADADWDVLARAALEP